MFCHFILLLVFGPLLLLTASGCAQSTTTAEAPDSHEELEQSSDDHKHPNSSDHADTILYEGKTLSEWIEQSHEGRSIEERQAALEKLKTYGLNADRERTLQAFEDAFSHPDLQPIAASGVRMARLPESDYLADKLVMMIETEFEENSADELDISYLTQAFGALGNIAFKRDKDLVFALRRYNEKTPLVDDLLDKALESVFERIKIRDEVKKKSRSNNRVYERIRAQLHQSANSQ